MGREEWGGMRERGVGRNGERGVGRDEREGREEREEC